MEKLKSEVGSLKTEGNSLHIVFGRTGSEKEPRSGTSVLPFHSGF